MSQAAIFFGILVLVALGSGQQRRPPAPPRQPPASANDWMKAPTSVSDPDPVPQDVRKLRDEAFDDAIGFSRPLQPGDDAPYGQELTAEGPEIPDHPLRAIVIAKFTGYRSILSASRRSIYTEMTFHVSRVFEDVSGHAAAGADITLFKAGGTVRTESGQVLSYEVMPEPYSVKPNGTYLLILGYYEAVASYGELADWDLSDGTVKANTYIEVARVARYESTLVGLTQDEVTRKLDRYFGR
jgi:hypothetical protein